MTCDARWIYLVGQRDVAVTSARDGMPGWARTLDAMATVSIALVDDLVLLADGRSWSALDSDTGISLWEVVAAESPVRVLDALGAQFLAVVAPAEQAPQDPTATSLGWRAGLASSLARLRGDSVGTLVGRARARGLVLGSWQVYRLADGSRIELADDSRIGR